MVGRILIVLICFIDVTETGNEMLGIRETERIRNPRIETLQDILESFVKTQRLTFHST